MGGADAQAARGPVLAFAAGGLIGTLGGLMGLGGAEFRLPLLVGPFRFPPLEAIILNKAMSLIVVATALIFRSGTISFAEIAAHWPIIINLLAGASQAPGSARGGRPGSARGRCTGLPAYFSC